MLEIINHILTDGKKGTPLPAEGSKLVLEATDTQTAEAAIRGYEMDGFAHRPHYVLDPDGDRIYKILDTSHSVVGDFHPTAPHRNSRCIFVAIVKNTTISPDANTCNKIGQLLRSLCDLEGVPAIRHPCTGSGEYGFDTLKKMEGIVCKHVFPGNPEELTPGYFDWESLDGGLQGFDAPALVGVVNDGETLVFEEKPDVAEETPTEDLNTLKVAELKEIASELGLSFSGLKKAELIDAITAAR